MTPKERVTAFLSGKPVDKLPNFNILMSFAARYIGRTMDEFCRDFHVLTEGNLRANEMFGIDLLNTMSDAYRETADYGAAIRYPTDALPVCDHLIQVPQDLHKIAPFRIEESIRMLDRLRAIEHYRSEVGDHWPIMGWIEGCAAETADLMGLSELVFALYDEPEMVRELFEICFETAKNCIEPQVKAGADIIGVGDAVASVLGPEIYRTWILPFEKKIFAEIHRCGAKGRLHICGDIAPILEDIGGSGADIVDVDWMVDFKTAYEKLSGKAVVCGNFDPVSVVQNGSPETVRAAVRECIRVCDNDCIVMAGCEIPRDTPHENLMAVHEALAEKHML